MRRALLVLAVVTTAVGGTLIYFGTRSLSKSGFERHLVDLGTSGRPTTSTSVLLPEGTWTFGSGPAGFAVGRMHITGGPPRRNGMLGDSPIPGTIEVLHRDGEARVLEKVTVGATGRFRLDLPAGNYRLVGRSPNVGEEIDSQGFTINVGRTTAVDLVVQAT